MKKLKIKLPLLSFVLILSVVMFSCKKKKTAPSVSLNGASSITLCVGAEYVEAGASATDAYGDDIDVVITSNVNTAQIGTYTVEYTATDKKMTTLQPKFQPLLLNFVLAVFWVITR